MSSSDLLSNSEEAILTGIGYLVVRWNYAESFARQLLRRHVPGDSLFHPEQLKLSQRQSWWIEDALQSLVLPKWQGIGRPYLQRLVESYARAREHRNHLVHGIYMTFEARGPNEAQALLYPAMPKDGKPQSPTHVPHSDIRRIAHHFHDLAMFIREVSLVFDEKGDRAVDNQGAPVLAELPVMITPLYPCTYATIDPALFGGAHSDA